MVAKADSSREEDALGDVLDLDIEALMDVEVTTATKTARRLSEVPATTRVITAEQIRERGYFTLEEALADLPGFQFRNIQGFNSYSFMRGVPSQNNLIVVMVDGVQINELNSGGFYGGMHYNLSNVKQIEVVYGPASALYGTHAASGIINIITRDPEDIAQGEGTGHGHVSALRGDFNTENVDFAYAQYNPETRRGLSLSDMKKTSNKAELRGAAGDNNWSNAMQNWENDLSLDGKIRYGELTLGFVYPDKDTSAATSRKTVGTNFLDSGVNWHIRFVNV